MFATYATQRLYILVPAVKRTYALFLYVCSMMDIIVLRVHQQNKFSTFINYFSFLQFTMSGRQRWRDIQPWRGLWHDRIKPKFRTKGTTKTDYIRKNCTKT